MKAARLGLRRKIRKAYYPPGAKPRYIPSDHSAVCPWWSRVIFFGFSATIIFSMLTLCSQGELQHSALAAAIRVHG